MTKEFLDPALIPKFVNQLTKPPVYKPSVSTRECDKPEKGVIQEHQGDFYAIDISEFKQQILPEGFPETTVWGYGGMIEDPKCSTGKYFRSSPGPTFEAVVGRPITVKWINKLSGQHMFPVDPTLHWSNPNNMPMDPPKPWPLFPPGFKKAQMPVPIVTHLHGGEVPSIYDGHPDAWYTFDGKKGPSYVTNIYSYPNKQPATTLWYHDHALGITRLNVNAGLAGFYLIRNPEYYQHHFYHGDLILPRDKYEIPIVIQDKSFYRDGSFSFDTTGVNPDIHPYWTPEFFGDTIVVNGKAWPKLEVDRRQYRFRILNGSNARFYNLKLSNGMKFIQIGTDGGFLPKPVELDTLLIAPAERADILIDFSQSIPGTSIILLNDANAPFPDGDAPDPSTVGQILKFTISTNGCPPVKPQKLPSKLNDIPTLVPDSPQRILTLNEIMGPDGPVAALLDGQNWSAPISELPRVGSTEEWVVANL